MGVALLDPRVDARRVDRGLDLRAGRVGLVGLDGAQTFPNSPRTLLTIMWRTENWTLVWARSRSQVAAVPATGMARAAATAPLSTERMTRQSVAGLTIGPKTSTVAPPGFSTATTRTPTYLPSGKKTNPLTGMPGLAVFSPR